MILSFLILDKRLVPLIQFGSKDKSELEIDDLKKNPDGRGLVVIPTGGGKTLTAIKTVNKLIHDKYLTKEDTVLWVTHLRVLLEQTRNVAKNPRWKKEFNFHKDLNLI